MRHRCDNDGVTITEPDGDATFFGRNPDNTYVVEIGNGSTFLANPVNVPAQITAIGTAAWEMTDHDITKYGQLTLRVSVDRRSSQSRYLSLASETCERCDKASEACASRSFDS